MSVLFKPATIIAHRGASAYAPENTMAALRKAKACGARWVEFDVMLTACGEVILHHDDKLGRTSDGSGRVAELPYSELVKLDAGSWFSKEYQREEIPRLIDVLDYLVTHQMAANIELKCAKGREQASAQAVFDVIQSHDSDYLSKLLCSSFSLTSLHALRRCNKALPLGLLVKDWSEQHLKTADELQCVSLHLPWHLVNAERVQLIKQQGLYCLVFTINDLARAEQLFALGVDAIFSDYPDLKDRRTFIDS